MGVSEAHMRTTAIFLSWCGLAACNVPNESGNPFTGNPTPPDPTATGPGTSSSTSTSSGGTSTSTGTDGGETTTETTGPMYECGDGVADPTEECDDGNDVNGDGCNADCTESADTTQWEQTHNGSTDATDVGLGITADSADNVIAVGFTFEDATQNDIWIRKYAPDGTETWTLNVAGMAGAGNDRANGVAVNGSDEIYVVGTIQETTGNSDLWLGKYDPAGTEIWTTTYDGPDGGSETGYAVAVGSSGIAVAGVINTATGDDILVRLYDDSGTALWTDTVDGPASATDQGRGVGIDSAGNVIVSGWINVPDQSEDAWLRKYDAAGTELWTETYADLSGGPDYYYSATVDANDNVLAGGATRKGVAGDNVIVRKYGPDAELLWTSFYNAPSSGDDGVQAIAADADGNVIAGGYKTVGSNDKDMWLRKYEAGGLVTWTQSRSGSAMQRDEIHGVAADSSGNILAIGELREGEAAADIWVAKFGP